MFLLTESTLYFLNLALNGRTSKKFSKGGQLKKWATGVAINANGSASPSITTATHTLPPASSSGRTTMSSTVTSAATSIHEPAPPYTQKPMSYEIFTDEVGETEERAAALSWNKGEVNVSHQIDELEQVSLLPLSVVHFTALNSYARPSPILTRL